jgi:hypothetical protein
MTSMRGDPDQHASLFLIVAPYVCAPLPIQAGRRADVCEAKGIFDFLEISEASRMR